MFINKQKGETKPFYSVLIDHRDFPFIVSLFALSACVCVCVFDRRLFYPQQSHPEAITFLGEGNDVSLYSIPGEMVIFSLSSSISIEKVYAQIIVAIIDVNTGLDYVSHDDVLPYMATGQEPFKHELFSQFLLKSDSTDEGSEPLSLSLSLSSLSLSLSLHRSPSKKILRNVPLTALCVWSLCVQGTTLRVGSCWPGETRTTSGWS